MNYIQEQDSNLYLPAISDYQEYGLDRRVSLPLNQQRQTHYNRVQPDANGSLRLTKIDAKRLTNRPLKEVIRTLIKASATMSDAMDLYRQYINSGHKWEAENTRDERILKDMEERCTIGGSSFQTIINQFVFGMIAEGAFCGEVTGDLVQGIWDIKAISPFEVSFMQEPDERRGIVNIIGQGWGESFVTLQDPRNPNPYFIYDPVSNDSIEPWGAIPFLPGIASELMLSQLMTKTDAFLDANIFPKGYFSFDFSTLARMQVSPDQVAKWVSESVDSLQKNISKGDITQSVITRLPTLWTAVGLASNANLDGIEMLNRMIAKNLQRAYKVPEFFFNDGQQGGIGGTRERTQMLMWLRRIRNYQRMVNDSFSQWGNIELAIHGSRNKCSFMLDDSDLEGERLIAEYDQLEAQARQTNATADETNIRNGIISREEARQALAANDPRYANIDLKQLPDMPTMQPAEGETDAVQQ